MFLQYGRQLIFRVFALRVLIDKLTDILQRLLNTTLIAVQLIIGGKRYHTENIFFPIVVVDAPATGSIFVLDIKVFAEVVQSLQFLLGWQI